MGKRDAFERAIDLMIDEAVGNYCENEIEDEEFLHTREFSKVHEKKMKRMFRQVGMKECMENTWKYTKRVACVFVGIVVLGCGANYGVKAWQKYRLNGYFDENANMSSYNYDETKGDHYSDDYLNLKYMPWGFEMVDRTLTPTMKAWDFKSKDEYFSVDIICVEDFDFNGALDTEDAKVSYEDIGDCEAIVVEKELYRHIVWYDGEYQYAVMGDIAVGEAMRIAKNLYFVKN